MNQAPAAWFGQPPGPNVPLHQVAFHDTPGSLTYMMPRLRLPGGAGNPDVYVVSLEPLSMIVGATAIASPELWGTPDPNEARRRCCYRHHDEVWDSGIITSFEMNMQHPYFANSHWRWDGVTDSYIWDHALDVFRYTMGPNRTMNVYPEPGYPFRDNPCLLPVCACRRVDSSASFFESSIASMLLPTSCLELSLS
jgi:hypothetical protein